MADEKKDESGMSDYEQWGKSLGWDKEKMKEFERRLQELMPYDLSLREKLLKVSVYGKTEYYPWQKDTWSVDEVPEMTILDLKKKVLERMINESPDGHKGNLTTDGMIFKVHGKRIDINSKNEDNNSMKFKDKPNLIGDVFELAIDNDFKPNGNELILPKWLIDAPKRPNNDAKKMVKLFQEMGYDTKDQRKQFKKLRETQDWTLKLTINKKVIDSGLTLPNNEIVISNATLVKDFRKVIFEELGKDDSNSSLLKDRTPNDVTLLMRYREVTLYMDDLELRSVGHTLNGTTVHVGLQLPFWSDVVIKLNNVAKMLEDASNSEAAKLEVIHIISEIKAENVDVNDSTKYINRDLAKRDANDTNDSNNSNNNDSNNGGTK